MPQALVTCPQPWARPCRSRAAESCEKNAPAWEGLPRTERLCGGCRSHSPQAQPSSALQAPSLQPGRAGGSSGRGARTGAEGRPSPPSTASTPRLGRAERQGGRLGAKGQPTGSCPRRQGLCPRRQGLCPLQAASSCPMASCGPRRSALQISLRPGVCGCPTIQQRLTPTRRLQPGAGPARHPCTARCTSGRDVRRGRVPPAWRPLPFTGRTTGGRRGPRPQL